MAVSGISTSSLGTGLDVATTVDQLIQAESGPLHQMQAQQSKLQQEQSTISSLGSMLSALKTSVDNLKDIGGALDGVVTNSTDASVATATADRTAVTGKHILQVTALATAASYYTAEQASSTASVGTGSFTIKMGQNAPVTVQIATGQDTLSAIADTVNALAMGVRASIVTDSGGARLALTSLATGSSSDINVSQDTVGLGWTKSSSGSDAALQIDGVPVVSSSNTVANVLQGVTINLNSSAPGTTIQLDIEPDTSAVTSAIQGFVNNYNSVAKSVNAQFSYDPVNKGSGILSGDPYLRQLQQRLLSEASLDTGSGTFSSLRSLGIELQNDGTLQVNTSNLNAALRTNFSAVKSAFQASGGVGQSLGRDLLDLDDPTTGLMNRDGQGITDQSSTIKDQIQSFNDYLTTERQVLTDRYTKLSVMMQEQPAQIAQIQAELGVKSLSMNVAAQYLRNSVDGKSGVGLVVVLYDALIASLYKGALATKAGEVEARTYHLNHAMRILGHLRSTIDHKAGGAVASTLDRYYSVTIAEILRAGALSDVSILERLISQTASVADAWREVDKNNGLK
ncbi:MAG: hypothetical protein NVS9B15_00370 [Acidobacteriaceae bacterium]